MSDQEQGEIGHLPRGILNQPAELVHENDTVVSDDEENMPLSTLRKSLNHSSVKPSKKRKRHQWSNSQSAINFNMECNSKPPSAKANGAESPVDFF